MSKTTDLCYPVLTPIKLTGPIIKPPCLVQLSAEDAAPLIAQGLIGADGSPPPDEASDTSTPNTTTMKSSTAAGGGSAAGEGSPAVAAKVVKPAKPKVARKSAAKAKVARKSAAKAKD
jgi:hypothetical protein